MAIAGAALRSHLRFTGRDHSTGELGTCGARVTTANRRKRGPVSAAVARCFRTESKAASVGSGGCDHSWRAALRGPRAVAPAEASPEMSWALGGREWPRPLAAGGDLGALLQQARGMCEKKAGRPRRRWGGCGHGWGGSAGSSRRCTGRNHSVDELGTGGARVNRRGQGPGGAAAAGVRAKRKRGCLGGGGADVAMDGWGGSAGSSRRCTGRNYSVDELGIGGARVAAAICRGRGHGGAAAAAEVRVNRKRGGLGRVGADVAIAGAALRGPPVGAPAEATPQVSLARKKLEWPPPLAAGGALGALRQQGYVRIESGGGGLGGGGADVAIAGAALRVHPAGAPAENTP